MGYSKKYSQLKKMFLKILQTQERNIKIQYLKTKAGKQAINNTTTSSDVKILATRHGEKLLNLIPR